MSRRSGGDLGKSQRTIRLGPLELRAEWVLLLLGLLAIGLIVQRQWLGLVACALGASALWPPPQAQVASELQTTGPAHDPAPTTTAPPQADGTRLMLESVLPIWSRQLLAIQTSVQAGTVELLACFSSMLGLQDQLNSQIQDLHAIALRPEMQQPLLGLRATGAEIQQQCESALQGLQFGDRVSQMVEVLHQDTERLMSQLPLMSQASSADVQAWLAALEASYTTDEQRLAHHGQAYSPQPSTVEYF